MSWIEKLYKTYNNCEKSIGYPTDETKRPLLPICHITAQAEIEVVIDGNGNFQKARLITDKNDATTIIPSTEGSAGRAGSKPEGHPLCDNLQYVAGDFNEYGGVVTSGFSKDPSEPYQNFLSLLTKLNTSVPHPKTKAILKYVKKKRLIKDLVKHKIFYTGNNGKLLTKRAAKKPKDAPLDIFDITTSQYDAFIRWIVEEPSELERRVWKDKTLWNNWIEYYSNNEQNKSLCYTTGKNMLLSNQHPKYIRAKGDGAKLISSNDTSGFTFRGRFFKPEEAYGLSLEVSQKAHNALLWLIDRQGKVFWAKGDKGKKEPGLTIVAWAVSGKDLPKITDDSLSVTGFDELPEVELKEPRTAQDIAIKFRERMLGYSSKLGNTDNVVVMCFDSASKGRLAMTYYREDLSGSDFLKRIEDWHKTCEWLHEYRYKYIEDSATGSNKKQYQPFIGAPAPINIAEAAYGDDADDKLKKATVARLLPCIIDGQQIPRDIVESVIRRACNRIAQRDPKDKHERAWNKTLSIACSLYKKHSKEDYNMALDENRNTRDYLYGRLLAIADKLEGHALSKAKEKRDTNAARYMQLFAEHPFKTWRQIELSLSPYKARLGGAGYYTGLIDNVMCKFASDDFNNDKPLDGEFLLGFHCQRANLWTGKDEDQEDLQNEKENG